jgi:hypothetical protein
VYRGRWAERRLEREPPDLPYLPPFLEVGTPFAPSPEKLQDLDP